MEPYNLRQAEARGLSVSKMENKKRKHSPIVRDRDDKVGKLSSFTGISSRKQSSNSFFSTGSVSISTGIRQSGPPVKYGVDVVSGVCGTDGASCVPLEGKYGGNKKAKLHNIGPCRWVDDVEDDEIVDSKAGKEAKLVGGDMGVSKKLRDDVEDGEIVDSPADQQGVKLVSGDMGVSKKLIDDVEESEIIDSPADMGVQLVSGYMGVSKKLIDDMGEAPLKRSVNMPRACRSVNEFEILKKLGEGSYGVVYKARNKKTREIVALKKVKMDNHTEGFPLMSLREINILRSSDHPSIIDLKEVVEDSSTNCVFLVMEYMDSDLGALIHRRKNQNRPFIQSEVKCLMLQLLQGVKYLHDNLVLHRDLKTSNLLLNRRGELKICDLGMARTYGNLAKPYTQLVVTLWYRAPELLLGAKQYSTAVDMWSVGCIIAELLLNQPLFNGDNEIKQIDKIFRMLGTPNETSWPGFSKLPGFSELQVKARFVKQPDNLLRKKFHAEYFTGAAPLSNAGFDLLNKLLRYDPAKRITADEALNHQWFREFPLPKSKDCMPTLEHTYGCNMPTLEHTYGCNMIY